MSKIGRAPIEKEIEQQIHINRKNLTKIVFCA